MDTKAVLDHHLQAFLAGDLDGVMEDYTDESAFITQGRQAHGLAEIRANYEHLLGGPFKHGTYTLTQDDEQISGDTAYIVWHADCAAVTIPIASDTFIVRDGKIAVQTVALKLEPKG